MSPRRSLLTLIIGELSGVATLVWVAMQSWFPSPLAPTAGTPEDAVLTLSWLACAALLAWLLLTTIGAVAAYASRIPSAIAAIDWITLPAIRAMAQRATALSIVASSMVGPTSALASDAPPIPVVVVTEDTAPTTIPAVPSPRPVVPAAAPPVSVTPAAQPVSSPATHPMYTSPMPTQLAQPDEQITYVVQPGDNMWTITRAHLADLYGRAPTNPEISVVWRQVIDLNEPLIRSGNADLIFPGERLVIPAVGA